MKFKIVSDSSSNIFSIKEVAYQSVPLKIITDEVEYIDNPELNVVNMVEDLKKYKGKSGSSCPNAHEWEEAFGDADCVFGITISSNLSGSYAAATQAAENFIENHPASKIFIIDSLSAGSELHLIIQKLSEYIQAGKNFEEIVESIKEYQKHTHLLFGLQSLTNLARNGRINPAVAKVCGIIGIRLLGKASDVGTLQPMHKFRSEKKLLQGFVDEMMALNWKGQKVRICHCLNLQGANQLKDMLLEKFPTTDIEIVDCTALCSFYAEEGGLLVGFEDENAK